MTDMPDSQTPPPKPVSSSTTIGIGFARSDSDDRMRVAVFLGERVAILSPEGAHTLAVQLIQNAAHVKLWAVEYAADEAARSAAGARGGHVWAETGIKAAWVVATEGAESDAATDEADPASDGE